MSIVTVPVRPWCGFPSKISSTPTFSVSTLYDINGVGQYVAWLFMCPKTVVVDRDWWSIGAATTGCTCLSRIETVDTATGLPTGTLVHANASQSVVIGSGEADYEVTYPGTFTLSAGTLYARVLAQSSGTPSGISPRSFADDNSNSGLPYLLDYDASAAARLTTALCGGIGLSGGGALPIEYLWPISAVGTVVFDSADTPDTIGNQFTFTASERVCGARIWLDNDSTCTVKLYDSDGATVLASADVYTNVPPVNTPTPISVYFSTPATLAPGTYYLAVEATGGSTIGLAYCDFPSAGFRAGSPMGGDALTYATCTQTPANTGSWTLTTTRQAFIIPIIDGQDDGAGSGGGGGETAHVFAS
jgi:hypothetical protein